MTRTNCCLGRTFAGVAHGYQLFLRDGHELHIPQAEQLPPHERTCLPARLDFIIEAIMSATIATRIILTIIVPSIYASF